MTWEIVYVPTLGEVHWYGCARIRRRRAVPPFPGVPEEVVCDVCRILVGSPSWE